MGLKKGDVVALLMENEPAFIWTFYGESYSGLLIGHNIWMHLVFFRDAKDWCAMCISQFQPTFKVSFALLYCQWVQLPHSWSQ
jgi:hypothetical protein